MSRSSLWHWYRLVESGQRWSQETKDWLREKNWGTAQRTGEWEGKTTMKLLYLFDNCIAIRNYSKQIFAFS